MIDKLEELNKKYLEVEGELSKPETVSDLNLFKKLNKEYKSLGKIVEAYQQHKATMVGIDEAKKIIETAIPKKFRLEENIKKFEDLIISNNIKIYSISVFFFIFGAEYTFN